MKVGDGGVNWFLRSAFVKILKYRWPSLYKIFLSAILHICNWKMAFFLNLSSNLHNSLGFLMQIHYMQAYFQSPYLSNITRSASNDLKEDKERQKEVGGIFWLVGNLSQKWIVQKSGLLVSKLDSQSKGHGFESHLILGGNGFNPCQNWLLYPNPA